MNVIPTEVKNLLLVSEHMSVSDRFLREAIIFNANSGHSFYAEGKTIKHVIFPADGLGLFTKTNGARETTELAIVGNEGLIGIEGILGVKKTGTRATAIKSGIFSAVDKQMVREEMNRNQWFQERVFRYLGLYHANLTQTAFCNQYHSLQEKFCRLLLVTIDRLGTLEVVLTHESIANILGSRRESISVIAGKLQKQDIINYKRGRIRVSDKALLREKSCSCYDKCTKEYRMLMDYLVQN
jgi:CRP-like cAMP-binding protein